MTLTADLGSKLESTVNELVKCGQFRTSDEVLREGIRLVVLREQRLKELDAMLEQASDELDAGLGNPAEEVFKELEKRFVAPVR